MSVEGVNSENNLREINLLLAIKLIWQQRKLLIKSVLLFVIVGGVIAVFSAKEYTATCVVLPQNSGKLAGGNLGGLAAIAGINLGSVESVDILSPELYPKILKSIPFQKELIKTSIKLERFKNPITLYEYSVDPQYKQFNLFSSLKKYTIGLPGTLINKFKKKSNTVGVINLSDNSILSLSSEEKKAIDNLKKCIYLTINSQDGYFELKVCMEEPLAAAQLAESVILLLEKYITDFRTERVKSNLDFIQERYNEAQKKFENIMHKRAAFRDANKNMTSAIAQTDWERIENDYNLSYVLYSELAKQLEQAKIKVKEDTPILTILDPVTIPTSSSKPRRLFIILVFAFIGFSCGIGRVLLGYWYRQQLMH